jgi:hypothetical protein
VPDRAEEPRRLPQRLALKFAYADPAQTQTFNTATYPFPNTILAAQNTMGRTLVRGCAGPTEPTTKSFLKQCEALAIPTGGVIQAMESISPGGSVPAEYVVASVTTSHGVVSYRLLVQHRWNAQTRGLAAYVTSIALDQGAPPNPWCVIPPRDPRFSGTPPCPATR